MGAGGDIGVNDWVQFLGRPEGYVNPPGPSHYTIGGIYRVTAIGLRCVDGAGNEWPALRTANLPLVSPRGKRMAAPVAAFRKIEPPRPELLESLLRKADTPVLEPA